MFWNLIGNIQSILILGRHIVTLLKMRLNPMHMAPFSVNITDFHCAEV